MRQLRNALFFLLGVLLVGVPMLVFAGTYPASTQYQLVGKSGLYATPSAACQSQQVSVALTFVEAREGGTPGLYGCIYKSVSYPNGAAQGGVQRVYSCTNGGTLNGDLCTKTCADGLSLNPDGSCGGCPKQDLGTSWYRSASGVDLSGTYCSGGCEVNLSLSLSTGESYSTSSSTWTPLSKWQNGNSCTAPSALPESSSEPPNTPKKDPPCAPGEGVIALNKGSVYCVPAATPGADTPKTSSQKETKTYPDGSTSTTTTTNTCTGHGACTSTTTTVITGASGGGAGQAGTPGTSTGKTDKPASEQSDFCSQNPKLQICKGNMAEEATQKQVLDTAKKSLEQLETITKPTVTDDSSLTEKGQFKESDELKTADKDASDRATGSIDPISAPKGAWESAMSSGFWSPIPQSGCSPHSSKIGPFQWSFDPCPIASKISEIGAYALWFILAISTFVMLTGGRKS